MASNKEYISRMKEVMRPIDRQIMMCDNKNELLMLATAMLSASKRIYISQMGDDSAREFFRMILNDQPSDRIPLDRNLPPEEGF